TVDFRPPGPVAGGNPNWMHCKPNEIWDPIMGCYDPNVGAPGRCPTGMIWDNAAGKCVQAPPGGGGACPAGQHRDAAGNCVPDGPGGPPGGGGGGGGFVTSPGMAPGATPFGSARFPMWVFSGDPTGKGPQMAPYGMDPSKDWNQIFGYTSAP